MTQDAPAHITLPAGGVLQGFPDLPSDSVACSTVANLQTQVAPLIATTIWQFRVLQLLKPLIDIVNGLPNPPSKARLEFSKAAANLAPLLASAGPAAVLPFVRDLLCLQIRSLKCFLGNLQTVAPLVSTDPSAVRNVLDSYPPVVGVLQLAEGLFATLGIQPLHAPPLIQQLDAASIEKNRVAVAGFVATLQIVVDALGGCQTSP